MRPLTAHVLLAVLLPSITFGAGELATIEIVPHSPPPYLGGESLTVDVWLRSNDVVSHDLRYVQLDIRSELRFKQRLIAAGAFTQAGTANAQRIAEFADGLWIPIGADESGTDQTVLAIAQFDDGTGAARYFGGTFEFVYDCGACPSVDARHIAKWDGSSWHKLGDGLNGAVRALVVHDDGSGPALYAGGDFIAWGGNYSFRTAKWDGVEWQAVGYGLNSTVRTFAVHTASVNPSLYLGGDFWHAYYEPMHSVANWDGSAFDSVGDELLQDVNALVVYDDGGGEALYAGGKFSDSGTQPLNRIARLDGDFWVPLGSGISGTSVRASTVFSTPAGDMLVVGGDFSQAGGVVANNIAQWDGVSWAPLGAGTDAPVNALAAYDDGTGQSLYAGGEFESAGGESHSYIARWDGTEWFDVAGGMNATVDAFAVVDGDQLPDIALPSTFDFVPTTGYFAWSALPWPALASTSTSPDPSMLHLAAQGSVHVGSLDIVLPTEVGS